MKYRLVLIAALPVWAYAASTGCVNAAEPLEIGDQTQLFVDDCADRDQFGRRPQSASLPKAQSAGHGAGEGVGTQG